jgi:MFS superfamily sulfate permease-like transporter
MNETLHKTLRLIEMVMPGVRVARTYQGRWLRPDLIAGAIIIASALNLIDFKPLQEVYRVRKNEFYLALLTLLVVLSVGVLEGILVAVLFSLLLVISRISRPHTAVLGIV